MGIMMFVENKIIVKIKIYWYFKNSCNIVEIFFHYREMKHHFPSTHEVYPSMI